MSATLVRVADVISKLGSTNLDTPPKGISSGASPILKGDFVIMTGGTVKQACATAANIATTARIGVCADYNATATGVATGTLVGVEKCDELTELELPIALGTVQGTPTGVTYTTALTYVGSQFGISRDVNGAYYMDTNLTAASVAVCELKSISHQYPASDAFITGLVKILPSNRLS